MRPVIDEGVYAYERVNVADQQRDPGSLLSWFAGMIRLRKECPDRAQQVRFRPRGPGSERLLDLRVEDESRADAAGRHTLVLDPYGYRWFRAGDLNYALRCERG